MPAKSKTSKSTKSRVSSRAKKSKDKKLFIALGVLAIAIVAVVGILWYRSSQAAVGDARVSFVFKSEVKDPYNNIYTGKTESFRAADMIFKRIGRYNDGQVKWTKGDKCAIVTRDGGKWAAGNDPTFSNGQKIVIWFTDNCN